MQGLTASSFGLIWVTLILVSFGQIFLKLGLGKDGVSGGGSPVGTVLSIAKVFLRPKVAFGFGLYVVGTLIWLLVLSMVPLSIAFPMFSMSYFLVVILSATILKERVAWSYAIVGLVLISVGVGFIGRSCPPKKHQAEVKAPIVAHVANRR
jgi:drug/metabolite transporter (DMT)-like permease